MLSTIISSKRWLYATALSFCLLMLIIRVAYLSDNGLSGHIRLAVVRAGGIERPQRMQLRHGFIRCFHFPPREKLIHFSYNILVRVIIIRHLVQLSSCNF